MKQLQCFNCANSLKFTMVYSRYCRYARTACGRSFASTWWDLTTTIFGEDVSFPYYPGVCVSLICSLKLIREQFANRCSRVLREQHCCSRNPLVRESIREQFANKLSLLFLGFFTKLTYFGGYFEKRLEFQRIFPEKFAQFV